MDPVSSADLSAGGKAQIGLIKTDIMTKSKSFDDVQKLSEKSKNSNKDRRRHSGSDRKGKNDNENNSENENENEGIDYTLSVENPMINRSILNNEIILSDNDIKDSFDDIDMQLTKRLSNADLEPYKKRPTITPENKNNLNILKSLGTLRPFKNFQKYNIFPQKSSSETDLSLKLKKEDTLSSQSMDKNVKGVKNNEENDDSGSVNDRRRGRGRERDGENDGERDDDDVDEDDEDEEQFSENLDDLSLERISEDRGRRSHESSEDLTAFDNYNDNDNDGSEIFCNNNDTADNENNTDIDPESVNSESVNKELLDSPMSRQKNYGSSNIETNLLLIIDENSQLTEEKVKTNSQKFGQNNQNEKIRENESGITDFGICETQGGVKNEKNIVNDDEHSFDKNDDNTRIELDAIFQKDGNENIRKLSNDGYSDKKTENLNDADAYVIGEVSDVSNQVTVATVPAVDSTVLSDIQSKKERKMSIETDKKNTETSYRESNKSNVSNSKSTNDVKLLRTYALDDRTVPSAPLALTKSRSTSSLRFQGEGPVTLTGIYPQGNQNAALNAISEIK